MNDLQVWRISINSFSIRAKSIRNKCLQRSAHSSALKKALKVSRTSLASKYYHKISFPSIEYRTIPSRILAALYSENIIPYISRPILLHILRMSNFSRGGGGMLMSPRGGRSRALDLSTGRGRLKNSIKRESERCGLIELRPSRFPSFLSSHEEKIASTNNRPLPTRPYIYQHTRANERGSIGIYK